MDVLDVLLRCCSFLFSSMLFCVILVYLDMSSSSFRSTLNTCWERLHARFVNFSPSSDDALLQFLQMTPLKI